MVGNVGVLLSDLFGSLSIDVTQKPGGLGSVTPHTRWWV
ncbi:MAG: hypothetical protein MjAS7_0846 [Metallosphaera javensis (ex Sakai et al. 2022)]|nr:MAG: hypothetical protein MjAS7_0846 [Metallosphaera javensis (ex Sakai et al. 2022)]